MEFVLVFVLWSYTPQELAQVPARDTPARVVAAHGAPARPSARDPWLGRDKLLHFAASAIIQGGAHAVLRANGHDYGSASRGAALATLTAGVGKELWDRHRGRDASFRDLAWDGIGGVTGAVAMRQANR